MNDSVKTKEIVCIFVSYLMVKKFEWVGGWNKHFKFRFRKKSINLASLELEFRAPIMKRP